jgi:enoyl-CoA hydratase/carnithine racemase
MTEKIQISLLKTAGNMNIGCIRLNKPKALNALDLDMVKAMQAQLDDWQDDDEIAAVFIDGEGEKAFCAGGDIVSMYQSMKNEQTTNPNKLPDFMAQFFALEYRLDYAIHAFPKPVICWGTGIIMGGGLGVFAGGSHKVITETARVAMPEITIGLFPDVGGSYFLNKMPKGVGKFLGLTASSINAADCIEIGLADYFLLNEDKTKFLSELAALTIVSPATISATINQIHNNHNAASVWVDLKGNLSSIIPALEGLAPLASVLEVTTFLQNLLESNPQSKMLIKAIDNLRKGSPLTAKLVIEQLARSETLSLSECLQMELSMAYQCSVGGEFQEGVRALLIDKDKQPKWHYTEESEIPDKLIEAHFNYFTHQQADNSADKLITNPLQSLVNDFGEAYA